MRLLFRVLERSVQFYTLRNRLFVAQRSRYHTGSVFPRPDQARRQLKSCRISDFREHTFFFSKAARAFVTVAVQQSQRLTREWYSPLKTVALSVLRLAQ
jgi:hypothetical protein